MRNKFKIDNALKTNKKKGINLKDKNKGLKNNKCWLRKSNKNKTSTKEKNSIITLSIRLSKFMFIWGI